MLLFNKNSLTFNSVNQFILQNKTTGTYTPQDFINLDGKGVIESNQNYYGVSYDKWYEAGLKLRNGVSLTIKLSFLLNYIYLT